MGYTKKRVSFVFVTLFFVIGANTSNASAWDNRDLEIQKAQAIVEGTPAYTIPAMKRIAANLEQQLGKEAVQTFETKLGELEAYASKLARDTEVGSEMRTNNTKLVKLYELIKEANKPMFELLAPLPLTATPSR